MAQTDDSFLHVFVNDGKTVKLHRDANFAVLSEDKRIYYFVHYVANASRCTCADFIYRRQRLGENCKHIDWVAEYIEISEGFFNIKLAPKLSTTGLPINWNSPYFYPASRIIQTDAITSVTPSTIISPTPTTTSKTTRTTPIPTPTTVPSATSALHLTTPTGPTKAWKLVPLQVIDQNARSQSAFQSQIDLLTTLGDALPIPTLPSTSVVTSGTLNAVTRQPNLLLTPSEAHLLLPTTATLITLGPTLPAKSTVPIVQPTSQELQLFGLQPPATPNTIASSMLTDDEALELTAEDITMFEPDFPMHEALELTGEPLLDNVEPMDLGMNSVFAFSDMSLEELQSYDTTDLTPAQYRDYTKALRISKKE